MDNSALIPDLDPITVPEDVEEIEEQQNEELVAKDQELASLLGHPGYAKVQARLDQYIDDFRSGKSMNYDANTPLEIIGQKYVVSSLVANICEELRDMVTDAANSVAEDQKAKDGR
jgi:hypothetical protein